MSKFNTTATKASGTSPVRSERVPSGRTYEGGAGYSRDAKGELFLLAVSNLVGEQTFYESGKDRDSRFAERVHEVAVADPEWMAGFLPWLRGEANLRSASLVGALEAARAMLGAELRGARKLVNAVLQRADEPGEALAYWTSTYGRGVPKPVKRGIADAVTRLYTERSLLKYDTGSKGFRFGDVIDLVHPSAGSDAQGDLFRHALDRRHERDEPVPESLGVLRERAALALLPAGNRRTVLDRADAADVLARAGMTWESLAGWLQGPMDAKAWETVVPSMGFMAKLRNLRNFDEAGVSDEVAGQVAATLADPEQVARSRQFPFRFLSAYEQAPSLRWGPALEKAMAHSLRNLPELPGRSLILVDTSGSMTGVGVSARSAVTPLKAAAVFGVSLAAKGEQVDLVGFANGVFRHEVKRGASVIREMDRFCRRAGEVGHGTDITGSLLRTYAKHDRVFIVSDMQTIGGHYASGVSDAVPANVPIYGFNLGGYRKAAMSTGSANRHEFGGLTDATFRMVPLLEAGRNADWPWLDNA